MCELETIGVLERRLSVALPLSALQDEIKKRLVQAGRNAKFSGFRPGKVPLALVKQHYGTQLRQEVFSEAVEKSFATLVTEHQLRVVGMPSIEYKPIATENAENLEYVATFEVYPEIKIGDLSTTTIEQLEVELQATDVKKTLDTLVKQRAHYSPLKRAAQNGDAIKLILTTFIDGEDAGATTYDDVPYVFLGDGNRFSEFDQQLLGLKADEDKTFLITYPDEAQHGRFQGKKVTHEVKCVEVAKVIYPKIDAEFAKSLGIESGDVNELKAEVTKSLQQEIQDRIAVQLKRQALEALLKVSDLTVPKLYLDAERENLLRKAETELKQRGVADVKLDAQMFTDAAVRNVKLRLLVSEVVRSHGLQANPEQIRAQVELFSQNFDNPAEIVAWYYSDSKRLEQPIALATENNVVQWVLERVTLTNKKLEFDALMGNS